MRRAMLMLLALFLIVSSGCAPRRAGVVGLAEGILDAFEREGSCSKIYDGREEPTFLAALYGEEEKPEVFSSVEEYAVVLARNDGGFEIHILKMRHLSETDGAEELLYQRKELIQSAEMRRYLGQRYEDYIASAIIYKKGLYVFLLVTGDNERAIDRIEEIL